MITPALTTSVPLPTSTDWQMSLAETGAVVHGVDDVAQCLRTILTTPIGSVPHVPTFGCALYDYLDAPITLARAQILRAVLDAIARWEPRADVISLDVTLDSDADDPTTSLALDLRWTLADGSSDAQQTTISVGGAA